MPSQAQGLVDWRPEGLRLPIVGIFDFEFADKGVIVDLKTTERMPFEIKIPHARQVALYVAATSNNYEGRLSYITPKKAATYRLENTHEHLKALHQIALKVEKFLSLSDDPEFFKSITVPDLEVFTGPVRPRGSWLSSSGKSEIPDQSGIGALRADRSIWETIT